MKPSWSSSIFVVVASLAMLAKETEQSQLKVIIEIANEIRLVTSKGGGDIGGGTVQIYHNSKWGTICDKGWSANDAKVVCKQLGYRTALFPIKAAYFGEGSGPIHLSNVTCPYGNESSISRCSNGGWGNIGSCTHARDAGVRCLTPDVPLLQYQGCWIDNPHNRIFKDFYSNRRRGGIPWHNIKEVVLGCGKDAIDSGKGFDLFGVQFFGECWSQVGNPDYRKMKAAPHACQLGVGEKSHNAVYSFGSLYDLGCWRDRPKRTMTLLKKRPRDIDWSNLPKLVDDCYIRAKKSSFSYFGIQFYGECWASNSSFSYKVYGKATNCYEGLGGEWANYVYKFR